MLGAIVLKRYTVSKAGRDVKRENAFKITKGGAKSYIFASESHEDMERYISLNQIFFSFFFQETEKNPAKCVQQTWSFNSCSVEAHRDYIPMVYFVNFDNLP